MMSQHSIHEFQSHDLVLVDAMNFIVLTVLCAFRFKVFDHLFNNNEMGKILPKLDIVYSKYIKLNL